MQKHLLLETEHERSMNANVHKLTAQQKRPTKPKETTNTKYETETRTRKLGNGERGQRMYKTNKLVYRTQQPPQKTNRTVNRTGVMVWRSDSSGTGGSWEGALYA